MQDVLGAIADAHKYRLLFATISGAHLYGFPSGDSDYDLRGVHVLPVADVIGLQHPEETVQSLRMESGIELDLVTHDIRKFFKLLLKNNGYVLEQLYSPLIVRTSPQHEELKRIAKGCITRNHSHHYSGFAKNQWRLLEKENPPRAKTLLYLYRVLMTGIHLMRTGEVQANIITLNEEFKLPYIDELVGLKTGASEKQGLSTLDMKFHEAEFARLSEALSEAERTTSLPDAPNCAEELDDLLRRVRLSTL